MFKELQEIEIKVNGEMHRLAVSARVSLLEVLRERLGLTGVKEGCGTAECGACTVILNGSAVASCSILAVEAHRGEILTVEGLQQNGKLHPLQQAFVDEGAVQCGFCTPGVLMSAKALLDRVPDPSEEQIKEAIAGNICRCTGYVAIVRAIREAARAMASGSRRDDRQNREERKCHC